MAMHVPTEVPALHPARPPYGVPPGGEGHARVGELKQGDTTGLPKE
jgi:hypothetical protein